MTLLGGRVGSGRTSPAVRCTGVLATSETVSWAGHYKYTVQALKHTTLHAHIQTFHTHTPGMRIGPVHDTGLSAVLWSSIPATASTGTEQNNRTDTFLQQHIEVIKK